MIINFLVRYTTEADEILTISFDEGKDNKHTELQLKERTGEYSKGMINTEDHPVQGKVGYRIILHKENIIASEKTLAIGVINIKKYKAGVINITHETIGETGSEINLTKAFSPLKQNERKPSKQASSKKATHIFRTSLPLLQDNKMLCLTGGAEKMNAFNKGKPLFFKRNKNNKGELRLNLSGEDFPVEYKIAVFDRDKKTIAEYEPGPNRIIEQAPEKKSVSIIYANPLFEKYAWKGAGINVPLFSLRSQRSWGTGDFTDMLLLIDYAAAAGFKLIQLLPINDTTSSATDKDSYPYSAISSFALHPKYMDVQLIVHNLGVEITGEEKDEIERLNALAKSDHAGAMKIKITILKKIFDKDKHDFRDDRDWFSFFDMNREWLEPYAAFCTLRDKYSTADFSKWEAYAIYSDDKIQHFTEPESDDYDNVLFWYYIQYHLHLQLKNVSDYAHKKGIVLKADLPIGVGRQSADTWQHPELFNMQMQAGAPPDAFSQKGQNWSFPTYNMEQMAFDNYTWLRKRMEHLEYYFDAVRIDHVLGLFRIWSIPLNQVDGRMGKFVPAIPLGEHDFEHAGLPMNEERYCSPFITEAVLQEKFGTDTAEVKEIFFANGKLAPAFNDQKKIADYFREKPLNKNREPGLMDVVADVILFKEAGPAGGYHFRINFEQTESYDHLSVEEKVKMNKLYDHYYYTLQNALWEKDGKEKLRMLKESTNMMLCAEDLGMVPDFTERVLHDSDILSLQVQQMPKKAGEKFSDAKNANYESVVMPATHDMPPIRLWWEQNRQDAQILYNDILEEKGAAPYFAEPDVCKKIINMHLQSPAMWSIFLLQDMLSINGNIRRANPNDERINDPADPDHVWNYRLHINLEELIANTEFNEEVKTMINESGR